MILIHFTYYNHDLSEETSSEEKNKAPLPVATEPADDNNSSWISYEDFISSFKCVIHPVSIAVVLFIIL